MGDIENDDTEHGKMVQTDTEIKRNSVIAGKPKPPLPKKPPIAVKPKVPVKSNSLERGLSGTPKTPPPLPKTPPKGPGGTRAQNARSSPSPDRSCDIKPINHVKEPSAISAAHTQSTSQTTAQSTSNHVGDSQFVAQSGQDLVDGGTHYVNEPVQSKTLERTSSGVRECHTLSVGRSNTLPKTPPKVSPKPSKRPPSVMPKPRLSKKLSESDLLIIETELCHNNNTSESVINKEEPCTCGESPSINDSLIDNQLKEFKQPVGNKEVKTSLDSQVQNGHSRPPPDDQYENDPNLFLSVQSKSLAESSENLVLSNCSDMGDSKEYIDTDVIKSCDYNGIDKVNNCVTDEMKETNDASKALTNLSEMVQKDKKFSAKAEGEGASLNVSLETNVTPRLAERGNSPPKTANKPNRLVGRKSESPKRNSLPFTTASSEEMNSSQRKVVYEQLTVQSNLHNSKDCIQSRTKSHDNLCVVSKSCDFNLKLKESDSDCFHKVKSRSQETINEAQNAREQLKKDSSFPEQLKIKTDSEEHLHVNCNPNSAQKLSIPSPAPRKMTPKPRPTPRKRLSISKGCDQPDLSEEYTDCMSARASTADLASVNSPHENVQICEKLSIEEVSLGSSDSHSSVHGVIQKLNDTEVNISGSKSDSNSHCSDQSLCNISGIENIHGSREKYVNGKLNACHNLLQPDDNSQRRVDFSPMTEEALGETSSLLDEIEQIVSRRISALGGLSSEFSLKKAHSIETSTPVRPPRRKHKNRKTALEEQFRDSCASDTDSQLGEASFKGSTSSLDRLDDGDQSFKGSNTSLASITSESGSRKPCPPKPPRKKLLKLNRSQSDVSAAKYNAKNGESNKHQTTKSEHEKYKKKVDSNSPSLSKKGRSLTVDFKVPANQEALLKELEIANRKKAANDSGQIAKPRRKAPPPPPPPVKVTQPTDAEHIREAEYHDIDLNHSRTSSAGEYVEIPEEFLECNNQPYCNENEVFQRSNKSPSPPELPPRNLSGGTPVNSPQLSIKSFSPSNHVSTPKPGRERPVSDISQNSSLSSQESPLQDELSSSDSDCEDEDERVIRKRAKKIFNIAKEIASSEHVFVDVLKLLNVDFRLHISRCTERAGRPVVPSEVLNRILKYLPQLQNFNEDLLRDLEDRVANWDKCQKVADVFVKKGPFLKMYSSYITDFEETNKVFDDAVKKIPTFQHSVKEFEILPRCASLGVRHYLLKPIQRIPQYKLLLQDYLKHLTPESEDYHNTKVALNIVSEVADHANSSMRQGDQVQKMLEIQKSLDGHFEVIKPGRDLIKEGELMKLSRKEMQPRMFFLFNDVLLYTTPTPTGGYRLNNVLTLAGMKVTLPASEDYNTEFNIVTVQRSFSVEASSVQERDDWVKALSEAISDYTQRRNTFETVKASGQGSSAQELYESFYDKDFVLGSKAPIWIPDARVTMCMLCTCEFSVAWRRHHCRSCGRVVCSSCSDNKAPLEYLRNKPARVCNECFQKLHTDFEEKVNTGNVTEGMTQDTDGSFLSLSSLKERFQQIRRSARFTSKIKRPNRLVEVHANDMDCSMSGTLKILKGKKWKKYWFLLKDKVLYKFKASEDVAAIDTMPVIGYDVQRFKENYEGIAKNLVFQLIHKNQSPLVFQTENVLSTERWIKAMENAAKG